MVYHTWLPHLRRVTLMICYQVIGHGGSDRLHNTMKRISTKTHNLLGDELKEDLTEAKMSGILKRSDLDSRFDIGIPIDKKIPQLIVNRYYFCTSKPSIYFF